MRILAVDTAAECCSAALVCKDRLLAELVTCSGQTHSRHLIKTIQLVLDVAGTDFSAIDGFAVSMGPGSFTGLRIGFSTVKGLAAASGKPLIGVSNLDVLAAQAAGSSGLICPFLDARKGEVYFSRYRVTDGRLRREAPERAASPQQALTEIDEACLFTGNGAVKYKQWIVERLGPLALFAPPERHVIRASTVAFLSVGRFESGEAVDLDTFAPNYVRGADARRPAGWRLLAEKTPLLP